MYIIEKKLKMNFLIFWFWNFLNSNIISKVYIKP
jgi:hypothetical protein